MDEHGVVKLSDYGFVVKSRQSDEKRSSELYRAPEGCGGKSDVWSLGFSLIELAEADTPYERNELVFLVEIAFNNAVPSLSQRNWPPEFRDFVNKCMVRDVNKRASVSELMQVRIVRGNDG